MMISLFSGSNYIAARLRSAIAAPFACRASGFLHRAA
jgi:hypothetical protein